MLKLENHEFKASLGYLVRIQSSEIKQQHWKRRGSKGKEQERTELLNGNRLKTVCVSLDGGRPVGGMFWRG